MNHNVQDYGASPNASASANDQAFAAALAAAVGGVVEVPPGTYLLSQTLTIPATLTLRGAGVGATVLRQTAPMTGVQVASGAHNAALEGFALEGAGDGLVIGDDDGSRGAEAVSVRNVAVRGCSGHGLWLANGNFSRLDHVSLRDNGGHGLLAHSTNLAGENSNAHTLTGVVAIGNDGDGLRLDLSTANTLVGVSSEGNQGLGLYVNRGYHFITGYLEDNASGALKMELGALHCLVFLRIVNGSITTHYNGFLMTGQSGSADLTQNRGQLVANRSLSLRRVVVPFAPTVVIDAALGNHFVISAPAGSNFTMQQVINPINGQRFTIQIVNASGGPLGAINWGGQFKLAPWTNPAPGYSRSIDFVHDQDTFHMTEVSRTPADVPV